MSEIDKEKHIKRHKMLHEHFDELVVDFIIHTKNMPSNTTVTELIRWSYNQTINPTTCED